MLICAQVSKTEALQALSCTAAGHTGSSLLLSEALFPGSWALITF